MTTIEFDSHSAISQFEVRDNCLCMGSKSVSQLADEAGQTPLYIYDRDVIIARIAALRRHLPANCDIHYAVKANPMPQLVEFIAGMVDGLDIASAGELEIVMQAGIRPDRVSFAGPCKRDHELNAALQAGIVVNLESERELDVLTRLGKQQGITPRVAVRVNPPFQLRASGMKMSGGAQQFGIDSEDVPALLNRMRHLDIEFIGFHIFSGSQNLSAEAICEAQQRTCQLAIELAAHAPAPVKILNIGGGFGIPYFRGDQPLDIQVIGKNLAELLPGIEAAMPETRVAVELGRYLVGESGVYLCRVIDRKVSRGKVFLVTDGGMHHHLAAAGLFGQVIRKNYPVIVANKVIAEKEKASVVGPLCTPLDLLADSMMLSVAEPGDLIAVFQSGAYGRSASPLGFLGHPPPQEILV